MAPPGWTAVELVVAEDQLLASESYLAARAPIVAPEQLLEHTLFLWNSPDDAGPGVEVRGRGLMRIEPRLVTSDLEMLRTMAANGSGIMYGPSDTVGLDIPEDRGLVRVLPALVGAPRTLRLLIAPGFERIARVQTLANNLRNVARMMGVSPS